MANITNLTLEQLEGLTPFLNPRYVTTRVLERIKREFPQKPVWHSPDFKVPEQSPSESYSGLNICLACRRVYEISFQKDAFIISKDANHESGPYCSPCAMRIMTRS